MSFGSFLTDQKGDRERVFFKGREGCFYVQIKGIYRIVKSFLKGLGRDSIVLGLLTEIK